MRKTMLDSAIPAGENWLDLDKVAQVAVTSEDPDCPIESALILDDASGWRAGGKGEQTIRLTFDSPQRLRRIWLRFVETEAERTQEFTLRWRPQGEGGAREIVRQQWTFSPAGSTTEIEDYNVDLDRVEFLELTIIPDISRGDSAATLAEWRMA